MTFSGQLTLYTSGLLLSSMVRVGLCFGAVEPAPVSATKLAVREFIPKKFHETKLSEDLPVNATYLDKNQTLWMTGQKYLWKWNFHSNKLQKISIPDLRPDQQLNQSQIFATHKKVFIGVSETLWQISFNPLKVIRYQAGPEFKGSKSHQLSLSNGHILWTLTRGIILINPHSQKLKPRLITNQFKVTDQILFHEKSNKIWAIRENSLFYLNLKSQEKSMVRVVSLDQKFLGLSSRQERLMAHTSYSVLILNPDGDILRTIPVEGQNKIDQVSLSPDQDNYLFKDQSVEIFRTDSKKIYHARFGPMEFQQISDFQSWNSILTFVSNGKPRVFQLEGVW